jgi:DNA adenine methylase
MTKRPMLRYHGGKWRIAPWIISHFPSHDVYVEPYGGAASVLLRKERTLSEVYNDLDGNIVNIFRVMQDKSKADELARRLYFTPYARDEFYSTYDDFPEEDIERARMTIVRSFMGFGSNASTRKTRTGFRTARSATGVFPAREFATYPAQICIFTERLRGIVIEHRDAMHVMRTYDNETALHYVDPPYLAATRSTSHATKSYAVELTDDDHSDLCRFLLTLSGYVVLSGYDNDIYNDILTGWRKDTRECLAERAKRTVECLWLSPRTADELRRVRPTQLRMVAL